MNGPLHQWRPGDTFELISIRNRERVRFERNSLGTMGFHGDEDGRKEYENAEAAEFGHA